MYGQCTGGFFSPVRLRGAWGLCFRMYVRDVREDFKLLHRYACFLFLFYGHWAQTARFALVCLIIPFFSRPSRTPKPRMRRGAGFKRTGGVFFSRPSPVHWACSPVHWGLNHSFRGRRHWGLMAQRLFLLLLLHTRMKKGPRRAPLRYVRLVEGLTPRPCGLPVA